SEYLRMQALSRIYLDNIENLQSSWVTQGPRIGQVALSYGANDFGSVMMEENVVSSAGTTFRLNAEMIERLIHEAGYQPRRRDNWYRLVNLGAQGGSLRKLVAGTISIPLQRLVQFLSFVRVQADAVERFA